MIIYFYLKERYNIIITNLYLFKMNNFHKSIQPEINCCLYCSSTEDKFMTDYELGKIICTNCGYHIGNDNICEKQEWIYGNSMDNSPCNNVQNPYFKKQSTTVWLTGVKPQVQITHKYHHVFTKKEQSLSNMYKIIDNLREKYPKLLKVCICNDAKSFCQQLDESKEKIQRGNIRIGIIGAALLRALVKRNHNYLDQKVMAKMCNINIKHLCKAEEILDTYLYKKGYREDQGLISKSLNIHVQNIIKLFPELELTGEVITKLFNFVDKIDNIIYKINNKKNNIAIACIYHILKDYYDDNLKDYLVDKLEINEHTLTHCYDSLKLEL